MNRVENEAEENLSVACCQKALNVTLNAENQVKDAEIEKLKETLAICLADLKRERERPQADLNGPAREEGLRLEVVTAHAALAKSQTEVGRLTRMVQEAKSYTKISVETEMQPLFVERDHRHRQDRMRIEELETLIKDKAPYEEEAKQAWAALRESQGAREKEQSNYAKRLKEDGKLLDANAKEIERLSGQISGEIQMVNHAEQTALKWRTMTLEIEDKTAIIAELRGEIDFMLGDKAKMEASLEAKNEELKQAQDAINSLQAAVETLQQSEKLQLERVSEAVSKMP